MQSSLLDTLFLSEKRKDLLLFLKDGAKNTDEIKAAFDFPWKSMIPQIKKLDEWELVTYKKGNCSLTTMGEVIVENMDRFLMTLKAHEYYGKYWLEHDLKSIPKELLYRIGELGHCEVLEPNLPNVFEQQEEMLTRIDGSDRIMVFISIYHPAQLLIFSDMMERGTKLDMIITEEVYRIIKGEIRSDITILQSDNPIFISLKEEYEREMDLFFKDKRSNVFIYRENVKPLAITVTDRSFSLALLEKNGRYNNCMITSSEPAAISWGEELFNYYKNMSDRLA
ncbi:winged helix-turn-helix domain-containing protein [Methanolobus sp. ZRKC3]|uniref:helix-turn-helix transcriptional regulator n=1 Tax=Methanolobus sp. ZRKC3 TaxID=3125786 RepID=UPI00324707FF